jgi:hypothetical protein
VTLPTEHLYTLPDEIADIPEKERGSRVWIDGDFAKLDQRCFVRCRFPLRLRTRGAEFVYVAWVQVAADQFSLATRLMSDAEVRGKMSFVGLLANRLIPFDRDIGINVNGGMAPGSTRCVAKALEGDLAAAQAPPGLTDQELAALIGEVQGPAFEAGVEQFLAGAWGPVKAAEEFAGRDWRRSPRRIVIAEFPPGRGATSWLYATLGLSARPMPGSANGFELVWKATRRVENPAIWAEMARTAAIPWILGQAFFHGHLQFYPAGFPPGTPFQTVLFADASSWDQRLTNCTVLDRPVRFLKAVPVAGAEMELVASSSLEEHLPRMLARPIDIDASDSE